MVFELRGYEVLDKVYEEEDINPGAELSRNYSIPAGEIWYIAQFGGCSNIDNSEVELKYSNDNGQTWTNPFDNGSDVLRCLHLQAGNPVNNQFTNPLKLLGGEGVLIQILLKNRSEGIADEIVGWFNGWRE